MNKNILLYTIMFGLSLSLLACESRIIPRDVYLRNAKKHMEKRYKEEFDEPYMYDENKAMISPITDDTINIVVRCADWDGDGKDEWRDNYMMYKFRPMIYEDVYKILSDIYEDYKLDVVIRNSPEPNVRTKEEIYKLGVTIDIYTTKGLDSKDKDVDLLKEGLKNINLYATVTVMYLNSEEFEYAGERTVDRINQYKLYNAKKLFFMYDELKEYDWKYGNLGE